MKTLEAITPDIFRLIEEEMKKHVPGRAGSKMRSVLLAIDGRCGSGKTTLAEMIAQRYGASVIHMDDFFLRQEQRTPERLAEPGGNVDRERFRRDVLFPIREGKEQFEYHRYDCTRQELGETVHIIKSPLIVIEGAYSCHPYFGDIYDIRIFMDVDPAEQQERILARNGREMLSRFISEWIPKEELYFRTFRIKEKCSICLAEIPHFPTT